MKISKYLTVAAIAITIFTAIPLIAKEGFNEEVWNRIILLSWMGNSLMLTFIIEKAEDENRGLHNRIVELLRWRKELL